MRTAWRFVLDRLTGEKRGKRMHSRKSTVSAAVSLRDVRAANSKIMLTSGTSAGTQSVAVGKYVAALPRTEIGLAGERAMQSLTTSKR